MSATKDAIRLTDSIYDFLTQLDLELHTQVKPLLASFPFDPERWMDIEQRQNELLQRYIPVVTQFLDKAYASLTEVDGSLAQHDRQACIAYHRMLVQPFFLQSQFVRRALDKPLGYAGDYVVNEMLFANKVEGSSLLARLLTYYALNNGPAKAHRGRMPWAHDHIRRQVCNAGKRPIQILSFACGPEHVLREFAAQGGVCEITLCDHDSRALEYCRREFKKIAHKTGTNLPIHYVELSATTLLKDPTAVSFLQQPIVEGSYDVILVLGLLDYLPEQAVTNFMDILVTLLRPGGVMLLTNVHRSNLWRSFMEYVGEWRLLYRDEVEFHNLMIGAPERFKTTTMITDDTGVNLYFAGHTQAVDAPTLHALANSVPMLAN